MKTLEAKPELPKLNRANIDSSKNKQEIENLIDRLRSWHMACILTKRKCGVLLEGALHFVRGKDARDIFTSIPIGVAVVCSRECCSPKSGDNPLTIGRLNGFVKSVKFPT